MTKIWEAIDRLEDGAKWGQGHLNDGSGQRCIVGALFDARNDEKAFCELGHRVPGLLRDSDLHALASVITEQFGITDRTAYGVIWRFNDDRSRTFDEVRTVMEKAAISQDEVLHD